MKKFLTILLTSVMVLLYYVNYQNGDNIVHIPMLKSQLSVDFDIYIKTSTVIFGTLYLVFMSKNFVYIQGTVYAFIMVLTAMFSAGLIWFIIWDPILSNQFLKWFLVTCCGVGSFYISWSGKNVDTYPVLKSQRHFLRNIQMILLLVMVFMGYIFTFYGDQLKSYLDLNKSKVEIASLLLAIYVFGFMMYSYATSRRTNFADKHFILAIITVYSAWLLTTYQYFVEINNDMFLTWTVSVIVAVITTFFCFFFGFICKKLIRRL